MPDEQQQQQSQQNHQLHRQHQDDQHLYLHQQRFQEYTNQQHQQQQSLKRSRDQLSYGYRYATTNSSDGDDAATDYTMQMKKRRADALCDSNVNSSHTNYYDSSKVILPPLSSLTMDVMNSEPPHLPSFMQQHGSSQPSQQQHHNRSAAVDPNPQQQPQLSPFRRDYYQFPETVSNLSPAISHHQPARTNVMNAQYDAPRPSDYSYFGSDSSNRYLAGSFGRESHQVNRQQSQPQHYQHAPQQYPPQQERINSPPPPYTSSEDRNESSMRLQHADRESSQSFSIYASNQPDFPSQLIDPENSQQRSDSPLQPSSRQKFRRGWTKEEHIRFLIGVYLYGRGNWKSISKLISGKSPKQVQSHAQKYFLRQGQTVKTKRSIHDFNFTDLMKLVHDDRYRNDLQTNDNELFKLFSEFDDAYKHQQLNGTNPALNELIRPTSPASLISVSGAPSAVDPESNSNIPVVELPVNNTSRFPHQHVTDSVSYDRRYPLANYVNTPNLPHEQHHAPPPYPHMQMLPPMNSNLSVNHNRAQHDVPSHEKLDDAPD